MEKHSKYIRLPLEIIRCIGDNTLLNELLVVSTGYRSGFSHIGYLTERLPNNECFMHYCISGQGWINVNDQITYINPGDLILCRKNTKHSYGANKDNPWETCWIYFMGTLADEYINLFDETKQQKIIHIKSNHIIEKSFYEITKIMEKGYAGVYLLHASNLLKTLLSSLSYQHSSVVKNKYTLEDIIEYMIENINEHLSLDELSKKMNMSKDHFTKIFYKKYGYTPVDYFIRIKLQQACQILITTDLTIKETALKIGYQDSLYFSRIFKKKIGSSPNQYRNKFSN